MEQNLVFFRTEKGVDEVATRRHHLPHRLRAVLLLVNGSASVRELQQKTGSLFRVDEMLEQLALDGYIALHDERWAPAAGPADDPEHPSAQQMKARLIDLAVLVLGKDATVLVNRLKDAPADRNSLQQVMNDGRKQLRLFASEKTIRQLLDKAALVLGGAEAVPPPTPPQSGGERLAKSLKEELIRTTHAVLGENSARVVAKLEHAPEELTALRHAAHQCENLVRLTISEREADDLKKSHEELFAALARHLARDTDNVSPLRLKV